MPGPINPLMFQSLSGASAANPAANPEDDAATRMALEQASQLDMPGPAPQVASPLMQSLALLAANSGAHLLQRPGAAQPAYNAVAAEQAKPERYRRETIDRQSEARELRVKAMVRAADLAARKAELDGNFDKQLKLLERKGELDKELEELRNKGDLDRERMRGANAARTAAIKHAFSQKKMDKWPEYMKRDYSAATASAGRYLAETKDFAGYHQLLEGIHDDFEQRDRALGGAVFTDRYGNPAATGAGSTTAPPNTGAPSAPAPAAGAPAAQGDGFGRPGMPSGDPKISRKTRELLYKQGK